MAQLLSQIKLICLKLSQFFGGVRHSKGKGFSGLGQFVLLLAIAPFIFDLSLYRLGQPQEVPSLYEYDVSRFPSLAVLPDVSETIKAPTAPKRPRPLSKSEEKHLKQCEAIKKIPVFGFINLKEIKRQCSRLQKKNVAYARNIVAYNKAYTVYTTQLADYQDQLKKLKQVEAETVPLPLDLSEKTQLPDNIEAKEFSNPSFTALLGSIASLNVWKDVGTIFWGLGTLLIGPAVWLSIRRRCWGLLICGLVVPAINYGLFAFTLIPGLKDLSNYQLTAVVLAQVAFAWFALKGHLRSKSFALFVLFLSITVSWAASSLGGGFSVFQAHLPILIFIGVAAIARLVVVGIKENAYLFVKRGWRNNLRQAGHAFLLWLPLALLGAPVLYLTEVGLPKAVVTKLHQEDVLQHPYGHDILDNALQSVAVKTDDASYALQLSMENTKRDIVRQGKKLQNTSLTERVYHAFDRVMPAGLTFDEYESDRVIIGPAVELAVGASQDSTDQAFKRLRKKMRAELGRVATDYQDEFEQAVGGTTEDAIAFVEEFHRKGQEELFELNRGAQETLWWGFIYVRTLHMLGLIAFIFVSLKSYVYVFSRVSFNRNTGTFVTLGDTEGPSETLPSQITPCGLQYVIEGDVEETYYISRRFQSRGKAPRYTLPQPLKAWMARLRHGAYSMNKVEMKPGDDSVRCTATRGVEFFEWELRPDEPVLFDFYNFVGMSEGVKLSTHFSTRASSLLLGKMIRSQATGPGKLILMAEGRAEVTDEELHGGSLPPERIIATQLHTRFHVDSELDLVNVYLSTAYVRPAGGGQVIVDVDSQRGNKTGLGSFIKRFLLPI